MLRFVSEKRIEELSKRPFFSMLKGALERLKEHKCTGCNEEISGKWKDELSWKEYNISGMCQDCQDNIFGGLKNAKSKDLL